MTSATRDLIPPEHRIGAKKRQSLRQPPTPLAYRLQDAGDVIGVGKSKLYELIEREVIEARKLDGATIVLRSELERFLSTLPKATLGSASD